MYVVKSLIKIILLFLVVAGVAFFVAREVLLFWGVTLVKNSLRTLSLSQSRDSFQSKCAQLGSIPVAGEDIVSYQLRFLSSKEFVLEAVCDQLPSDPILIKQVALPQFVTKVPGTSGFIFNEKRHGIELQVFAQEIETLIQATKIDLSALIKNKLLVAENGVVITDADKQSLSQGPVTNCNGYGYECCQPISQVGVGDQILGLSDCDKTCYFSCASRPTILSFNTSPIINPGKRLLIVRSGELVEFTYIADAGQETIINGVLDFGDGKKTLVTGLAGQASHTYVCNKNKCEYIVRLTLEDKWEVKSANTDTSKIKIIVER